MTSLQDIIDFYVKGIILRSQGIEVRNFSQCRNDIKQGLTSFEWLLMGVDNRIFNVVINTGDMLLADEKTAIALNLYREASLLFPDHSICYIKQAQCQIILENFPKAKKACKKAIHLGDGNWFKNFFLLIDEFVQRGKIQEAHDLYVCLKDQFPNHPDIVNYGVMEEIETLKTMLGKIAEEEKKTITENRKRKKSSKGSSDKTKTRGRNINETSNESSKLCEATGGNEECKTLDADQCAVSAKAKVKTAKQLKKEQIAREKLIQSEIEKAAKEQEEKLKKQEEVKERKKQEREERKERLRKEQEKEARRRRDEEKRKKELEKQKNKEMNKPAVKRHSRKSNMNKVMNTQSTQPKNSLGNTAVAKRGGSLNDMPTALDHSLSTGSLVRCVCPKCNTPRVLSVSIRNCHSCNSQLVIWYRKVGTSSWTQPRKAPKDVPGSYQQCKHFLQGKQCVKSPCKFAHGRDEMEIWDLCRGKRSTHTARRSHNESLNSSKTSAPSLSKPWSSMTLNSNDSDTRLRSRTESFSSQHSTKSFPGTVEMPSSGDMFDDFGWDAEFSPLHSQDVFDDFSQDSATCLTSTSSLFSDSEIDGYFTANDSTQSSLFSISSSPVEIDKSDDELVTSSSPMRKDKSDDDDEKEEEEEKEKEGGWMTVGSNRKIWGINKRATGMVGLTTTSHQDFVSKVMTQEKLRCNFCDIRFSSESQLEYHYTHAQHRVNIVKRTQQLNAKSVKKFRQPPDGVYMGRYKLCRRFEQGYCYFGTKCTFAHGREELEAWCELYKHQAQNLAQLEEKQLWTESFSEKVRQRIQKEGRDVLKVDLPGVTVKCSSPWRVELDVPQDHVWIIDVQIQTTYRLLLSQVAFLSETHLDKFTFLSFTEGNCSSNVQSIRLLEEDFVEDIARQETAVQFRIQFSSKVFGDFRQTLVFDFGNGLVLARSLSVSIVCRDMYSSKEVSSSRTSYCHILEWSEEEMELVNCKDLPEMDLDRLCDQYSIPDVLPDLSGCTEFTRETYCKLWHDILFIEEEYIQKEVARYDILDGEMKILNSFQNANETVFAQQGELYAKIYLSDYLVMDEVAGNLISRSVMSVILRPKLEQTQSNRVYECSIKMKTSQLVIIKLNAVLCQEYVFENDQVIYIDLKFRYNRLPMCEMHQTIDRSQQKTEILLPNVKSVSYKEKKSIPDWFLDKKPNENQHEAIAMILDPSPTPPILVIGPFGTGKTYAISLACVSILTQSDRNKVLICTHSNSAADIHLQHLDTKKQNKPSLRIRPLRVLSILRKIQTVAENLRKYCLIEEITGAVREPKWNEIDDRNVIITTLASSRMLWKFYEGGRLRFTHILIDEAAQALEPECVTPLVMADKNTKVVLAGDHKQDMEKREKAIIKYELNTMPRFENQMGATAYSKCLWPDDFGPKRSLLERLFAHYKQCIKTFSQPSPSSEDNTTSLRTPYAVLLTENYRCHAKILEFPSDCFYGGELIAKGDQNTHDSVPVLSFYTAQGVDQRVEESLAYYNEAEVAEVVKQVEELVNLWPKCWGKKDIGVLTPYHDQVKRIRDGLRKKGLGFVDVETVENVQGKEFKALFISTVRTMWTCSQIESRNVELNSDLSELDFGFLSNPRFLNTAVTRAQSLLAVVGDPMSLCSVGTCRNLWKDFVQRCDGNKGLYGCTLKTVMDFCLSSQVLNPSAHEFIPSGQVENNETSTVSSSKGDPNVSGNEKAIEMEASATKLDKAPVSNLHSPIPTTTADRTTEPVAEPNTDGGVEQNQVDGKGDLAEDNQTNHDENAAGEEENNEQDDPETSQAATDIFFRRDGTDNFDKIIEELVKACQKTKKKDAGLQKETTNEDFPPLNDNAPTTSPSTTPHWPNISIKRTFSAGWKDGRIELGFHVKDSERLFRLTGGKLLPKEKGDNQSLHDIEASPEDLMNLLEGNPTRYTKCSFRVETGVRQRGYSGRLPTPDSPDIKIPGRVRGVYEDDVVVLELQPEVRARDEEGQRKETAVVGYIKGILRRLIEPRERQFVCTIDRANQGMMIPINKKSPKLVHLTKSDEDMIPIYTLQGGEVSQAEILKKHHHREALAGERVFVVKYLKWRSECAHPLGLAVRHIPHGRDFKTGMEILYEEHNVKRKFDQELRRNVSKEFKENWQVPTSEKGRPVYCKNVFTIDPPESLDLDDAISVRSLGNGNFNVQIHIADVSYFVKPNTKLDKEARLRSTSYYPPKPEVTVPMLPPELSEGCCSLLQGEDRLAVTVSVELKPDGADVGDVKIERSLIRSSSRLTYHEAQQIIDETKQIIDEPSQQDLPVDQEEKEVPVKEAIGIIHRIAQGRRRLRLGLERSLYSRQRDDCNESDDEQDAHQMIEEIMIMTNHFVAKYLLEKFPKRTPLRVQPPRKDSNLAEWQRRFHTIINFSLELKLLGDSENTQEETIELKVPFKTWAMIMSQVNEDFNFQELVKLVCDPDLFPQLALANLRQQISQERSKYICSGETFENIPFPWPQHGKGAPTNQQTSTTDGLLDVLDVDVSLSEDNTNLPKASESSIDNDANSRNANTVDVTGNTATPSCSSLNEGNQCSVDVSSRDLNKIFYGHSSLCLDAYCHFTSPIRRYIDIIVHRLVVSGIENKNNAMDPEDITTICDRCTFFARNCRDFDKDTKKLQLAVSLQGSFRFVSAFVEEIEPDALRLFFGTGKFEVLNGKSVRIARLGPDKDPQKTDGQISLQWTFRVLRLDKQGRAQPRPSISDDELAKKLESQADNQEPSNTSEVPDDFDYVVTADQWNGVLEAVRNQDQDELKSQLQKLDGDVQKQKRPEEPAKVSLMKRLNKDPNLSSNAPYQPPNVGKTDSTEEETVEFLKVTRSFNTFDRVKVQTCSQMNRGLLSPTIQLFKLTDKILACVEHRSFPTTCFAKTSHKRPTNTEVSNITEYVQLWKPVLMMEIATSAVREDDAITLSNVCMSLVRDLKGLMTMKFDLSCQYCEDHFLDPLDLNLICVRIKDPDGTGKDTGYWVGHFQISEELRKKEDAGKILKEVKKKPNLKKADEFRPLVARLIHSSSPVPESLISQEFCYASVELIFLSIPDRRRLGALVNSVVAPEHIQDICIGKEPAQCDVDESSIPENLSLRYVYPTLPNFYPLNPYQQRAVQRALTQTFTLIQGPPGTGKTVTGVHIAYWFAQLNRRRKFAENEEGEENRRSMVFYCGPSNKSVDVVARYLMKIPDLKILRLYGQEIERKVFPVPDKVTLFRSKRVPVQLKADEDLKNVSLHHVIRSAECPFAEKVKEYDEEFKKYTERNENAPRSIIDKFNQVKSEAEKWAITRTGVNVILVTCTSAYSPRIPCQSFINQCIIDECGMCIEAETLCAMLGSCAKQIVLIGDHKQLQPVIQCDKAKDLGLGISMFERFSERALMLEIQYRMHENLCKFPSDFFYDGKLKTANEVRARKPDKVTWPNGDSYPFEFHHVEGVEESLVVSTDQGNENSKKNQKEVNKVVYVARRLTNDGIKGEDIVVLSPYRAQCFEITNKLKEHSLNNISVMSVVAAQGSEKNYVILSLVRSVPKREIERNPSRSWLKEKLGFITDEHQINVALTRAKRGLCIIGNANLIGACSMWSELLEHYKDKGCFY